MAARTLERPPSILPLYGRAAAAMIPGASLLPFIPGGGEDVPEIDLVLANARANPRKAKDYAQVCGFAPRETLPVTYPHVLAFPLHMAAMADGRFPFGAVGLVHVENAVTQRRPIGVGETMEIRVRSERLKPHPSGRTFALLSEARVAGELVWEERSTFLRRGGGGKTGGEGQIAPLAPLAAGVEQHPDAGEEWRLPGDLGRRYAGVSGDRNPIHLHPLTARALGFPRAIAHGMWSMARCAAALEERLPAACQMHVRFRKPILLPAAVRFASVEGEGETQFAIRSQDGRTLHLEGRATALEEERTAT
jgi:acyl dehydratase